MKKLSILALLSITLMTINGCCVFHKKCPSDKTAEPAPGDMEMVILDESQNGRSVSINAGQNISINLRANPSTGYRWSVAGNDEAILPLISRDYKQREAEPGMVGVGGTLNLIFKGIKAGQVKLKLEYSKPLASEGDTVKYFEMDITVK